MTVPPPVDLRRATSRRRAAREALEAVLWDREGHRRLPSERALRRALEACAPRDAWWVCEASSYGPCYLLPTRPWVRALAAELTRLGVHRVLEVCAGDGLLARSLARAAPGLRVHAADDRSWEAPEGRMSSEDRALYQGVPFGGLRAGAGVEPLGALEAIARHAPELVLVSWAPPGPLVEALILAPVRYVLELGVDGDVTGDSALTWRYRKEFLDGPVEARALCRLDRADEEPRTRVTLYYGAAHPEHGPE
ncbi:MAG: hypothetical protein HY909_10160 [Deltaproteobacteria bacterium]|nr:hypothetical protein [Deltaproteobacteria bacterium]